MPASLTWEQNYFVVSLPGFFSFCSFASWNWRGVLVRRARVGRRWSPDIFINIFARLGTPGKPGQKFLHLSQVDIIAGLAITSPLKLQLYIYICILYTYLKKKQSLMAGQPELECFLKIWNFPPEMLWTQGWEFRLLSKRSMCNPLKILENWFWSDRSPSPSI